MKTLKPTVLKQQRARCPQCATAIWVNVTQRSASGLLDVRMRCHKCGMHEANQLQINPALPLRAIVGELQNITEEFYTGEASKLRDLAEIEARTIELKH